MRQVEPSPDRLKRRISAVSPGSQSLRTSLGFLVLMKAPLLKAETKPHKWMQKFKYWDFFWTFACKISASFMMFPHLLNGCHHHVLHRLLKGHDLLDLLCKSQSNLSSWSISSYFCFPCFSSRGLTLLLLTADSTTQHKLHQLPQLSDVSHFSYQAHVG